MGVPIYNQQEILTYIGEKGSFYCLQFPDIDNYYQHNKKEYSAIFSIEIEFVVFDKHFKKLSPAVKYFYNKGGDKNDDPYSFYKQINISILKKNNIFETIWVFKNPFIISSDGVHEIPYKISLENSLKESVYGLNDRILINFKNDIFENGYILYTLSYEYKGEGTWELVDHEKIDTDKKKGYFNTIGYCREDMNKIEQKEKRKKHFILNDEELSILSHPICNEDNRK